MNKIIYANKPDFNLIADTLARLLSEQYEAEITIKMTPKENTEGGHENVS